MGDFGAHPSCDILETGVALVDARSRICYANLAFAERLGRSPERCLGQPLQGLAPGLLEAVARCRNEGRPLRLAVVDFGLAPPLDIGTPVRVQPLPEAAVLIEVLPATTAVNDPLPALRSLAHELRNPLAGMRGAAQLLERALHADDQRELAALIRGECDRLAALTERLLQGAATPRTTAFDVHEPIEHVLALLASQSQAPRLLRDFDPSLPPALGDPARVIQTMLNLARNALEAGARTITLRTRADIGTRLPQGRRALRIEVHDDGPGIPVSLRPRLFEPWVSGRVGGTGLGLALARANTREQGGELEHLPSESGALFVLRLPLAEDES